MTIVPPAPGEPRRPEGPRDPGDAWVVTDDGRAFRAEEKIDDMGFPEEPLPNVSTPADRRL